MKRRVTFSFEGAHEVGYVRRLPQMGDRVTHGGDTWIVSNLQIDEVGLIATCERLPPRQRRQSPAKAVGRP